MISLMYMLTVILFLFAPLTAWLALYGYNLLRSRDQIFSAMKPGTLRGLDPYITRGGYSNDDQFWLASKRYRGLWHRFHNARCLVRLMQHEYLAGNVLQLDVKSMTAQANAIALLSVMAMVEAPFHRMFSALPHLSARAATNLYAEMEAAVEELIGGNIDVLHHLRAVV